MVLCCRHKIPHWISPSYQLQLLLCLQVKLMSHQGVRLDHFLAMDFENDYNSFQDLFETSKEASQAKCSQVGCIASSTAICLSTRLAAPANGITCSAHSTVRMAVPEAMRLTWLRLACEASLDVSKKSWNDLSHLPLALLAQLILLCFHIFRMPVCDGPGQRVWR